MDKKKLLVYVGAGALAVLGVVHLMTGNPGGIKEIADALAQIGVSGLLVAASQTGSGK